MERRWLGALAVASGVVLIAVDVRADLPADRVADAFALSQIVHYPSKNTCEVPGPTGIRCFSKTRTDDLGNVVKHSAPQAFGPTDIQSAYRIPAGGSGKTVALIDFYHYASAESDLAVYRAQYGLPACTAASGCFRQVYQDGTTSFGTSDPAGCGGWASEAALDLQMVSAACPACKILLVEVDGDSQTDADLTTALATATSLGASAISNSYGGSEDATMESAYALYTRGILVTAASGDSGYGVSYPASSAGVIAVGGTSLTTSPSSRGWAESAWSLGGSGCSSVIAKPSWQTDLLCSRRTEVDVAANADPDTGVAIYCSDGTAAGGWEIAGGTSAASPVVAGMFVAAGVPPEPSFLWANAAVFNDVASGDNGSCSPSVLCTAGAGYDGPTGWGTPNGTLMAALGGAWGSLGVGQDAGGPGGLNGAIADLDAGAASSGSNDGVGSKSDVARDGGVNAESPVAVGSSPEEAPAGCACSAAGVRERPATATLGLSLFAGLTLVAGRRRRGNPAATSRPR